MANTTAFSGNIKFNKRFINQSIPALGWKNDLDPITEWIDNSISTNGNASSIWIDINNIKDRLYDLKVQDNGNGVLHDHMLESFATFGTDTTITNSTYNDYDINNFGSGGSASLVVTALASHTKMSKVISITEDDNGQRWKSVLIFDFNLDEPVKLYDKVKTTKPTGVTIEVKLLELKSKPTHWVKELAVIYFPNKFRNDNFTITIKKNGKEKQVKFEDPFYRDLSNHELNKYIHQDTKTIYLDYNGTQVGIDILEHKFDRHFPDGKNIIEKDSNGNQFTPENLYQKWDTDSEGKKRFLKKKSGLYIRVAGRYIKLGDNYFPTLDNKEFYTSKWITDVLNLLRFEIITPRWLMELVGASVDKNQVILNPIFCEAIIKFIMDRCIYWIEKSNERTGRGKKTTQELRQRLENALNKSLNKAGIADGLLSPALLSTKQLINKRNTHTKNPNGNGVKPGNGKNTHKQITSGHYKNSRMDMRTGLDFKTWGEDSRMYEFEVTSEQLKNGTYLFKFNILINEDHPHFGKFEKKSNIEQSEYILDLASSAKAYKDMIEKFSPHLKDKPEKLEHLIEFVGDMWDISSRTRSKLITS